MSSKPGKFHSPLSRAKGHGASHSGVGHWWLQRVTSVALIVLLPWFAASLICSMLSQDVTQVAAWFASPLNSILMIALLVATFWHAKLGFQVVIEDYIHTPFAKYFLLIANNFIAFACALAGSFAVLRLHMLDLSSFGA